MLIEFTVGNYRSFKDKVTLSLVAANIRAKDQRLDAETTIPVDARLRLLTSAAIYGANASGKSNLVQALAFMRSFVLTSATGGQVGDRIEVERFRLSTETEHQPSFFEIAFLIEGKKYRYGFEVTPERVTAEWLFATPSTREARLFERDGDTITVARPFAEGRKFQELTRPNALFLSVVAQFNGAIAGSILGWFRQLVVHLGIIAPIDLEPLNLRRPADGVPPVREHIDFLRLIRDLDLGIDSIRGDRVPAAWSFRGTPPPGYKEVFESLGRALAERGPQEVWQIRTTHPKYDAQGNAVGTEVFDLDDQESAGTRRLFGLARPIFAALRGGQPLVIDEIEARLHPLLIAAVIDLFNHKASNPHRAQLIFTTHDTNLLHKDRFRRDQIWFLEKDRFGVSSLYSLVEFKVRNDASFEQNYLEGRYGGVPYIPRQVQVVAGGTNGAT